MTNAQIQLVQVAKRQLQLEDGLYRQILHAYGEGVTSCTKLSNAGLERVMAFLEGRGFRDNRRKETYWRDIAAKKATAMIFPSSLLTLMTSSVGS